LHSFAPLPCRGRAPWIDPLPSPQTLFLAGTSPSEVPTLPKPLSAFPSARSQTSDPGNLFQFSAPNPSLSVRSRQTITSAVEDLADLLWLPFEVSAELSTRNSHFIRGLLQAALQSSDDPRSPSIGGTFVPPASLSSSLPHPEVNTAAPHLGTSVFSLKNLSRRNNAVPNKLDARETHGACPGEAL
jgi:hypothetical protein